MMKIVALFFKVNNFWKTGIGIQARLPFFCSVCGQILRPQENKIILKGIQKIKSDKAKNLIVKNYDLKGNLFSIFENVLEESMINYNKKIENQNNQNNQNNQSEGKNN